MWRFLIYHHLLVDGYKSKSSGLSLDPYGTVDEGNNWWLKSIWQPIITFTDQIQAC